MTGDDGLILAGLAGENPLAALAALATLRVLGLAWPDREVRLSWRPAGTWRPVLHVVGGCSRVEAVAELDRRLRGRDRAPEFTLDGAGGPPRELTMAPGEFAEAARAAARAATRSDRAWADFCAAYGTDAVAGRAAKGKPEGMRATAFRFTSGQQHFLKLVRQLAAGPVTRPAGGPRARRDPGTGTTADHLDRALFERWAYVDAEPSLRWDPVDDRRHALRAEQPSDSPILTVRGANRLAVEALPWLPTFGRGEEVMTRGWERHGADREPSWTWPIWGPALAGPTVASLLGLAELVQDRPPRDDLLSRGVAEVYRARRVGDYYGNFSPGVALWGRGVAPAGGEP